jgi:site-specific recombinase XerD
MQIEEFESVEYWLESMAGRAKGTKVAYASHLKFFCEWLGKTPDELIAERDRQLKSEDKKIQRTTEMYVKRYNTYLTEKDAGAGTKKNARAAIKSFFELRQLEF